MIKKTFNLVLFILCIILALGIPGFVYKYEAVLSGKVLALQEDNRFFIQSARKYNLSLSEYFDTLKNIGKTEPMVFDLANYEEGKIKKLIIYTQQLKILAKEEPFSSLQLIITSSSEFSDIQQTALKLYRYDLALINSSSWIITCLMVAFILFGIIKFFFYTLLKKKRTHVPQTA